MSIADDIAALRAALAAGPSPGPWKVWRGMTRTSVEASTGHLCALTTRRGNGYTGAVARTREQMVADGEYIAACEPDRIRRLLDALDKVHTGCHENGR